MNADSAFFIGKDHTICEDYALAGVQGDIAYAIVCDGCSASPDVDFGARILAFQAKFGINTDSQWNPKDPNRVGSYAIYNARNAHKIFFPMLHPQALDATLLAARVKNNRVMAVVYGDGVIVHRSKNEIKSAHIRLTSGAPDYLSYTLDEPRMEAYNELENNVKEVHTSYDGAYDYKPFVPFVYDSPVEEGDTISLITDGIDSFRRQDNSSIKWEDLVDEFTGFKNFEGQFALRRITAFKRKALTENWHHLDDISIASIHV